jgi:hypothetical protein
MRASAAVGRAARLRLCTGRKSSTRPMIAREPVPICTALPIPWNFFRRSARMPQRPSGSAGHSGSADMINGRALERVGRLCVGPGSTAQCQADSLAGSMSSVRSERTRQRRNPNARGGANEPGRTNEPAPRTRTQRINGAKPTQPATAGSKQTRRSSIQFELPMRDPKRSRPRKSKRTWRSGIRSACAPRDAGLRTAPAPLRQARARRAPPPCLATSSGLPRGAGRCARAPR